jgi:predicted GNAT family N-acyltransferase
MPDSPRFTVRRADWPVDEAAIAQVRRAVFIEEQSVAEALEWEEMAPNGIWYTAVDARREVVGIVHLAADAHIYRMAVLAPWRRQGVGAALLATALAEARRQGHSRVQLSAQTHATAFYARFGFQTEGQVYQDAGIPHISMTMTFKDPA